jgi:hypothetical protein
MMRLLSDLRDTKAGKAQEMVYLQILGEVSCKSSGRDWPDGERCFLFKPSF